MGVKQIMSCRHHDGDAEADDIYIMLWSGIVYRVNGSKLADESIDNDALGMEVVAKPSLLRREMTRMTTIAVSSVDSVSTKTRSVFTETTVSLLPMSRSKSEFLIIIGKFQLNELNEINSGP